MKQTPQAAMRGALARDGSSDGSATDGEVGTPDADAASATAWTVTTAGPYVTLPALGPNGTVYVGSWDGRVYAVSPSGQVAWTFTTQGRIDAPPVVTNEGIFVSSWDGSVYALAANGALAFRFETGAPVDASAAVDAAGNIYVASQLQRLYALAPNGTLAWSAELNSPPTTAPALDVSSAGTRVLVGTADGKIHIFTAPNTEAPPVQLPASAGHAVSAFTLANDGTAYAETSMGHLVGVSTSGTLSLDLTITYPGATVFPPALAADGTLYVGATDRTLYAVAGGSVRWSKSVGGSVLSAPTLGTDGSIYLGAKGIVRVSASGSTERIVDLPIEGAPVLAGDAGWYANTLSGALVSGRFENRLGLADAPWPTQQGGYDRRGMKQR